MKRLILAFLLFAAPASAQVSGTLTWAHTRPSDLSSYTYVLDGGAPVSIGLPTNNSVSLPLAVGAHTLVLNACYTDTTCSASATYNVTVVASGPLTYDTLTPVDAYTMNNGQTVTLSVHAVDNSGIALVTGYWSIRGGAFAANATTRSGDTYSFSQTPQTGAGARAWYFKIKAGDGETVQTPTRTITVQ